MHAASQRRAHDVTQGWPRLRRWAAVLCVAAALLTVGARRAAADERPVLVVDATDDGAGAVMAARISVALGPDPVLTPVAPRFAEALRHPTPADPSWRVAGDAALTEARDLLAKFAYRQAADRARGAQDAVAGAAGDPVARKLLADLVLAEGLGIAGEAGLPAAATTFALVHRLDPGRTLDPARYLPDRVQAFAAAATPATPSGVLSVSASGAAEVLIDGVAVGAEPAKVTVVAGPHIVTVRGEDIQPKGRRVESAVGQTVSVPLTVVVAPDAVRVGRARDRLVAAQSDRARADAVARLLGLVDARDAVIVTTDATGELVARLYTAASGLGPPRPIGDDLAAVVRPLRPLLRPRLEPQSGLVRPIEPGLPADDLAWWRQPWAKVTFGATAGVIVIGVVAAIVTRDTGSSTLGGVDVE